MTAWSSQRTLAEAIEQLEKVRIPCGPVYDLQSVLTDPQVRARELLTYVEYPATPEAVPVASTPVRLSQTPGEIRHRAPLLGEHTDEVLKELGFTEAEIDGFRSSDVI